MASKQLPTVISITLHTIIVDELKAIIADRDHKIAQLKHDYNFRHNQALALDDELKQTKHVLMTEKIARAALKQDIARLLFLKVFDGGTENAQMLTRCRNRVIDEIAPVSTQPAEFSADKAAESPQPLHILEKR